MNENMNDDRDDEARQLAADEAFALDVLRALERAGMSAERRREIAAAVLADALITKARTA